MSKATNEIVVTDNMSGNDTLLIVKGSKTQRITANNFLNTFGIGSAEIQERKSRKVTSSGDITSDDQIILADSSSASFNLSLPPANTVENRTYTIKEITVSTFTINIIPDGADLIDNDAALSIGGTPNLVVVDLYSDGSNW